MICSLVSMLYCYRRSTTMEKVLPMMAISMFRITIYDRKVAKMKKMMTRNHSG